jgi:chromosome partitioning related protein ParA
MYVIVMISTKGGVGKTSLTANLGALYADLGVRVLLIDTDPQASLSKYYPLAHTAPEGLVEMIRDGQLDERKVSYTVFNNLAIVLSNDATGEIQIVLPQKIDRSARIKWALNNAYVNDHFDLVIVDTQGAVGALQEAAAFAADVLLSPISPDILSAREFLIGTTEILKRMEAGRAIGLTPGPLKALIYKMDHTRNAKAIAQEINQSFLELGGRVTMLNSIIRSAKAYTESATEQIPVHCKEIISDAKSPSAYTAMHRLAWELIPDAQIDGAYARCFGAMSAEQFSQMLGANHE